MSEREASASSPTHHHRRLPVQAAPAALQPLSLRPHKLPPPPASLPANFVPHVLPPADLASRRPRLRSVVVAASGRAPAAASSSGVPALSPRPAPPARSPALPAARRLVEEILQEGSERPWLLVQRRSSRRAAPPPAGSARPRPPIPLHLRGLCCNCLRKGHFIAACTKPIRCRRCQLSGHKEKDCTAPPPAPPQHRSAASSSGLRREGDHRSWSAVAAGVAPSPAPALQAWPRLEPRLVAKALQHEFDIWVLEVIEVPRLLMEGVDSALAEENARVEPPLLPIAQGVDEHFEEVESHGLAPQPPEVAAEVRPSQEPIGVHHAVEPVQEMLASDEACHSVALAAPAIATEVVIFDSGADVLDAEPPTLEPLLDVGPDDDVDDDAALLASSDIALRGVAALFGPPAVSLLRTPLPPAPRAPVASPAPDRRSARLAAKPILPAVDKAVRVLHKKMGLDFGDMPLVQAREAFASSLKTTPLSSLAVDALSTLFRLNLPSMTASDEALIALAGSGGSDFSPSAALDDSV